MKSGVVTVVTVLGVLSGCGFRTVDIGGGEAGAVDVGTSTGGSDPGPGQPTYGGYGNSVGGGPADDGSGGSVAAGGSDSAGGSVAAGGQASGVGGSIAAGGDANAAGGCSSGAAGTGAGGAGCFDEVVVAFSGCEDNDVLSDRAIERCSADGSALYSLSFDSPCADGNGSTYVGVKCCGPNTESGFSTGGSDGNGTGGSINVGCGFSTGGTGAGGTINVSGGYSTGGTGGAGLGGAGGSATGGASTTGGSNGG
jgi:hypothetical protein